MIVNRFLVPLLAVGLFLGVIGGAVANGNWIVSGKEMVDLQNMGSGAEIKGWMTLQQVADAFAVPPADLYQLSGIPTDVPMDTALKDLEGVIEGFEISLLREQIDGYLGASAPTPAIAAVETAAVETAVGAAASAPPAATLAPAPPAPVVTLADVPAATEVHVPKTDGAGDGTGPTPLPPGETLAVADIKGRHTLAEIADQTGVPLDALVAALDLPANQDPTTAVRDLMSSGLIADVDAVRAAVTDLQAQQNDD